MLLRIIFFLKYLILILLNPLTMVKQGRSLLRLLTKEALPVIRYRTRDISRVYPNVCRCGRTLRRMAKVTGRTDDMLIIRGVNIFPSQVEHVLMDFQHTHPHYQLIATREGVLDVLEVKVEVSAELFSDEMKRLVVVRDELKASLEKELSVQIKLSLVEPGSLERFTGKAKRVIEKRAF